MLLYKFSDKGDNLVNIDSALVRTSNLRVWEFSTQSIIHNNLSSNVVKDNKTFLDLSAIRSKLLQQIQLATAKWARDFLQLCVQRPGIIKSWIDIGDDTLLEALFDRMKQSLEQSEGGLVCFFFSP